MRRWKDKDDDNILLQELRQWEGSDVEMQQLHWWALNSLVRLTRTNSHHRFFHTRPINCLHLLYMTRQENQHWVASVVTTCGWEAMTLHAPALLGLHGAAMLITADHYIELVRGKQRKWKVVLDAQFKTEYIIIKDKVKVILWGDSILALICLNLTIFIEKKCNKASRFYSWQNEAGFETALRPLWGKIRFPGITAER